MKLLSRIGILLKWAIACVVMAALLLFSANNRQAVAISLLPFPYETRMPLFLLAVLAFCAGLLCGGMILSLRHISRAREAARLRARMAALENEIAVMKLEAPIRSALPPAA